METFSDFLRRVLGALNRSGLQYVVTGALAASHYGRPRTTLDVDLLVAAQQDDLAKLAVALSKAGLNVQKRRLSEAWESEYRIATLEDRRTPHTLDIIFTDQQFEASPVRLLGIPTYVQSAESLVLAKLRMLKVTIQAERAATDREDIKAILANTEFDLSALRKKARAEGTIRILDKLLSQ